MPTDPRPQKQRHGGCLCGAVRYVAVGTPINVRVCHCRTCQQATGQAFFARALFLGEAVQITGETGSIRTSEALVRRFCLKCGTPLLVEREGDPPLIAVALGSLDEPAGLPPAEHVFVSRKLDWLALDDGLPQHQEGAAA